MKIIKIILLAVILFSSNAAFAKDKQTMLAEFEQVIKAHKGKVIYLDFWASWCIPCRQSFPWMNEMQHKYAEQGLKIITVNVDADKANAAEFLADYPAKFDVIYDPKGYIARQFKLPGMPSSLLYDRQGNIVANHVGFNDAKKMKYQQSIEALLAN